MSWEGNASRYRLGGLGRENVLTVEVLQALDFLPRDAFLGKALRAAHGADASRRHVALDVENLNMDLLPGDLECPEFQIRAQPDALMTSAQSYVFVEAKRIRPASFQPEQLARELLLTIHHAEGRAPILLLILGAPPPVTVKGHGKLSLADAVSIGLASIGQRLGTTIGVPDLEALIAYVTWAEISDLIARAAETYDLGDRSTLTAIQRIAGSAVEAVYEHG